MSVNFGAGVAPAPATPNANDAPPLQQPVAQPNTPTVGTAAATVSPLTTPPADDSALDSTDPTLTNRESIRIAVHKLREDWIRVEKAIQEGDLKLVHHMLDEGLVLCVFEEDTLGVSAWTALPRDFFEHLEDLDLFDRFINLFTRHHLHQNLYEHVIQNGNGILLRRLVQSGVKGWQAVSQHFDRLISDAMSRGNAKQLNALLQLQKESYPSLQVEWSDIWLNNSQRTEHSQSVNIIAVLISHLKPSAFSQGCQAEMFQRAAERGDHHLVAALVEWLDDDIDALLNSSFWKFVPSKFSPETLATLVTGGFPIEGIRLPPPEQKNAQELQIVLYGPKLSKSPFAQMLATAKGSSNTILNFVFCKALDVTIDPFLNRLPVKTQLRHQTQIAIDLFRNGLAAPLAIKLAQKMGDFLKLSRLKAINRSEGFYFLAYLNECLHPDAVNPLQDSLSIAQAKIIHDASLAVLEQQLGGPIGFYSRALACIRTDGSVDITELNLIYRMVMGLPMKIVQQIGVILETLCAEVMTSAVPLNLIKPGMTGVDVQAVFHRWIQQGVAQRIINRLPQDLGLSIAKRDWDYLDEDSDTDNEDAQVALVELISPINYLATSVISQYGSVLAEDIEANSIAIVEACRALPPDAFRPISHYDAELDSGDASSSSDNEDPD